MTEPTFGEVIDCLRRECDRRMDRYPRLVQSGKLHPDRSAREILLMQRAAEILENLVAGRSDGGST